MRAGFPEWVTAPVQYGKRIGASVLYLLHYQLLPEKRLTTLMFDLFGVRLATATIARISQDCAKRFQCFAAAVRDQVAGAAVKHMDETGFRIGGKTQWLHIASTTLLTFYRVSARRGSLLANVVGIVVHDHWHPYYTLKGILSGDTSTGQRCQPTTVGFARAGTKKDASATGPRRRPAQLTWPVPAATARYCRECRRWPMALSATSRRDSGRSARHSSSMAGSPG